MFERPQPLRFRSDRSVACRYIERLCRDKGAGEVQLLEIRHHHQEGIVVKHTVVDRQAVQAREVMQVREIRDLLRHDEPVTAHRSLV